MNLTIKRASRFKTDYKQLLGGQYRPVLEDGGEFWPTVDAIAAGLPLPLSYRDHALTQDWVGHRECHIKPDLLLIYQITDDNVLILARLGSHAKVFKK